MTPITPDPKPKPATDEEIAKLRVELGNLWTWGSSPELAVHREHYMHLVYAAHKCFAAIEAERSENAKLRARVAELRSALNGLLLSADSSWEDNRGGHDWPEACQEARAALKPEPASR